MSEEKKIPVPEMRVNLVDILSIMQAKMLGYEAIIDVMLDIMSSHDFSKGPISREAVNELVKAKVEIIAKHAEEAALRKSNLIQPKSNLILPK